MYPFYAPDVSYYQTKISSPFIGKKNQRVPVVSKTYMLECLLLLNPNHWIF